MQRILTPELCPDEVFYEAFAALTHERRRSTREWSLQARLGMPPVLLEHQRKVLSDEF